MNWGDLNPFKKAPQAMPFGGLVYVSANPEHPYVGFTVTDFRPAGPSIQVEGIALKIAKQNLTGKVLDWDRFPVKYISALKTGGSVRLPLDTLKTLFR